MVSFPKPSFPGNSSSSGLQRGQTWHGSGVVLALAQLGLPVAAEYLLTEHTCCVASLLICVRQLWPLVSQGQVDTTVGTTRAAAWHGLDTPRWASWVTSQVSCSLTVPRGSAKSWLRDPLPSTRDQTHTSQHLRVAGEAVRALSCAS